MEGPDKNNNNGADEVYPSPLRAGVSLNDLISSSRSRCPPANTVVNGLAPRVDRAPTQNRNHPVQTEDLSPLAFVFQAGPDNMVREQEPARTPLKMSQPRQSGSQDADNQKTVIDLSSSPPKPATPAHRPSQPPTFGLPTPLHNNASPLAKPLIASSNDRKVIRKSNDSSGMFAKRRPGEPPGLHGRHQPPGSGNPLANIRRDTARAQEQSNSSSTFDPSIASRPQTNPFISTYPKPAPKPAPAYPTFSSNTNTNPHFRPVDNFIDLTKPASTVPPEDGFSDAHVFGNDRFGTRDPIMFMDSRAAGDDIKALLEGAMDETDDKPRTRRRKKESDKKVDDLTKTMQGLGIDGQAEESEEEELDDGTRDGLKVRLLPHQIDGVDWMISKETGARRVRGVLPLGGILADDMGLGKTIQSIALILANPRPADESYKATKKKQKANMDKLTLPDSATLVVAPLALIKQWEGELSNRVDRDPPLKVIIHHGPSRTKSYKDLRKADVVITTYQTLTSEHGENAETQPSALFGVRWWRILLDEAHSIKNRNAKSTKAACALTAEYRWCLTGTPMQNNLDELQSLINFLQIRPYNDLKTWKDQITSPMNNGRGGLAIRRLRAFLSAFMKRRTKDVLKKEGCFGGSGDKKSDTGFKLVKRTVENVVAQFSPAEREAYNKLEARTDKSLERMMAGNQATYASVLVLLMRMRQACNHYSLLGMDLAAEEDSKGSQTPRKTKSNDIDDIANMLGGLSVETKRCDICQLELSRENITASQYRCDECEADQVAFQAQPPKENKKKKVKKERKVQRCVIVDSDDEESTLPVSETEVEEESETDTDSDDEYNFRGTKTVMPTSSTKIRHLLKILKHDCHKHKYIVFSFFTSMLDLIEPFLDRHSISYVRYDGKMRNDAREAALESLRENPSTRVLLCSLRAGSLGLNLTAASRVVILEPFWNPFVEEQAIDRVHRLNQTQDVVVHKLTIQDSVESRILELQDKKRELARATIEGEKGLGAGKVTLNELLTLFGHGAEKDAKLDMIGMKDGRGLLERDSSFTGTALDGLDVAASNRMRKHVAKQTEHEVYGRRW